MPHNIEQYNSLSDLEREHTKSVYLRNEDDKRKGVEYVMSKILGFYKECLELGPEYVTGIADEGEVTTWMAFGGNTRDLGSFGEETDKTTDLHQNLLKNDANRAWRYRRDLFSDNVMDLTMASRRSRLKPALDDSTW
ncbi:hypothetical protein Tco_0666415 [Tanacetum coccineum]